MKHLIYAFLLVFSLPSFSQSRKSIEIPDEPRFSVPERGEDEQEEREEVEDQQIRKEWDEEESKAQARQEKQRLLDEERAKSDDLNR